MTQLDRTYSQISEFVSRAFPLAKQREIGPDDSLFDNGIIDSMGTLEVIQFLEDEFGIEVSDEEMVDDHFESINRIARLVNSKLPDGLRDGQ
ncbi:D-alanine--poly(phosphoribitol) ligase subunit 2 [Stieleria neptunia]|uniref:D-alanine--poly(Phosphoribitol) ligase subunit 2 n=1 Tax=Stieleria neptunia TaxID=2527979 RepID=A0A518HT55_9BACT|nr:acyl carrier protein [Stieleria neptunia]QDV44016.1 D-alanine--poly(phosphoribitol) ligase subunit 2 [Stieleria neptunia]